MTSNSKKGIGLAIIASVVLILVVIVVLYEENKNPLVKPEEIVVVEVEPLSVDPEKKAVQLHLRDTLILFAKQYMHVPYEYGSCNPERGFDCSGFVFFVFDHFGIQCPRVSKSFKTAGKMVELDEVQKGDVLVFTGTDTSEKIGGHVGIVLSVNDSISFIHSSSGSANGVTISSLNEPHYRTRFLFARDLISM